MASEQLVLIGNVLDAGDMGTSKDLTLTWDKLSWSADWVRASLNPQGLWELPVSGGEYLPAVVRGEKNYTQVTVYQTYPSSTGKIT